MEDEKKDQKVTEPIEEGESKNFCGDPKTMAGLFEKVNKLNKKPEEEHNENEEDFFAN